jgi:hypothetical protein
MTRNEILEAMGNLTSEPEAQAMEEILEERQLDPIEMTDSEFFALIPQAIERAHRETVMAQIAKFAGDL